MYIDSDTPLVRCAKMVQKDYVVITNNGTQEQKTFNNVTEFHGAWQKKEGGWLGEVNKFLGTSFKSDDHFAIETYSELLSDIDPLKDAEEKFDFFVGRMKALNLADDYKLVVGGKDNFRYDCAQYKPYKDGRPPKPLIYEELKELIIKKYKSKVIVANGMEADDVLSIEAYKNYQNYLRTKQWDTLLCFIDKDLKQCVSPYINPDKTEEGVTYQTPEQAAYCFAFQCVMGDISTDNIYGVPALTKEIREKYGLGNTKGVGEKTVEKLLQGRTTKEMFEIVVDCWKSYYGEEKKEFTSWRGDKLEWNWLDYLNDSARLLYLLRKDGEVYHISDTLNRLKVVY